MTLKELATLANVSVSTVSKAFSNSKGVSDEIREHIFKIAREQGCYEKFYKGNYFKKLIAVICPEIKSEAYHRLATYLETLITDMGATMVLSLSHFDPTVEETLFSYHAYFQKADGIIVIGNKAELKYDSSVPVVLIDSNRRGSFDSVYGSSQPAINEAIKYLMDMGHREIGFIGETLTHNKLNRFREAMDKYALPIRDKYIAVSNERFEMAGYSCMEKLISQEKHPTAILAAYDYMALGAIKCAKEHYLSIPEDISIIGMDDIRLLPYMDTPITSISSQYEKKCEIALDILQKKMKNKYFTHQEILLESQLIIRNSVRNLKES